MPTYTFDPTNAQEREATRLLIEKIDASEPTGGAQATPLRIGASTRLIEVLPELGANAQKLLKAAASNYGPNVEFALWDLDKPMKLKVESIKSIHRNMARALKARGFTVTDVLPVRWEAARGCQVYYLTPAMHAAILSL